MTDINNPISKRNRIFRTKIIIHVVFWVSVAAAILMLSVFLFQTETIKSDYMERKRDSWGQLSEASEESLRNASKDPCVKNRLNQQLESRNSPVSERDIIRHTEHCNADDIKDRQKSVLND